jgi:sugar lactone lactonase YvrE
MTPPPRWADLPGTPRTIDLDEVLATVRTVPATAVPGTATTLGEHPFWDEATGSLLRVDIDAGLALRHRPGTGDEVVHRVTGHLGAALPRPDGGLWLVGGEGLVGVDADGVRTVVAPPPAPHLRFNDAGLAPDGVVWAGVLPLEDPAPGQPLPGALLRLDPADGSVSTEISELGCPNAIVWTPDGATVLACESESRTIAAAHYSEGRASGWHLVLRFVGGRALTIPDGLEMLPDGRLWIAFWGLGAAIRLDPAGTVELVVTTAGEHTTSVATAPDGTVWITTADGLSVLSPDDAAPRA